MSPDDFESPFLDDEMPWRASTNGHQEAPAGEDLESQLDRLYSGEVEDQEEQESQFDALFSGEADEPVGEQPEDEAEPEEQTESSPDLFDPAELEAGWDGSSLEGDVGGQETGAEEEAWGTPDLPSGDEESPFLRGEAEAETEPGEDEGEAVFLDGEEEADPGQVVLLKKEALDYEEETEGEIEEEAGRAATPVHARILWPALGFPAVIAPRTGATGSPFADGDATRCITVLLRSNRKNLSKAEAARYLRYVDWHDRGRRHIAAEIGKAGWFREEELAVRNNEAGPRLIFPKPKGAAGTLIVFGGNRDGKNAITVHLADRVAQFYDKQGLRYLHEIRISEDASARLQGKQYHLFWNNQDTREDVPSDEMTLLLRKFAEPRRRTLGEVWEQAGEYLLREYEFEYGVEHPPYRSELRIRRSRTEVLHPLFIQRDPTKPLRIGHITDTHVDVRADVYHENLRRSREAVHYNNWNESFVRVYRHAKERSDVLLLTGDLIDYGRGHWGFNARERLGEDGAYHVDRNWFLFSYLLASDDAYSVPAYTILGNHDWRINPYPPFAPGAPNPRLLLHDHRKYARDRQNQIVRTAHGPGHEKKFSYYTKAKGKLELLAESTGSALKALMRMFINRQTMDEAHTPAETRVESVEWYLLSINPFLDYSFALPGGQRVLMLDWAENEDVLFPIVVRGQKWPYMLWQIEQAADLSPQARSALTPLQRWMTKDFVGIPGTAKVIGIHAPPIGPYWDWYDDDLERGKKLYGSESNPRGPTNYATRYRDGRIEKWNGHPLFAVRPAGGPFGVEADEGSFKEGRAEFIKAVGQPKSGVRAVFSGHIHRSNLLITHVAGAASGPAVAGQLLIRAVTPAEAQGARPPAVAVVPEGKRGPLYVNTTSGGPRGNAHPTKGGSKSVDPGYARLELAADGTIERVEFVSPPVPAPVPVVRKELATV